MTSVFTTGDYANGVTGVTVGAASVETPITGAKVLTLTVPALANTATCSLTYAGITTAAFAVGATEANVHVQLNKALASLGYFFDVALAGQVYTFTYAHVAVDSLSYTCSNAVDLSLGGAGPVFATTTAQTIANALPTTRVQKITLSAAFVQNTCTLSYAGIATGPIASGAAASIQTALNNLGLGSFVVTVNGALTVYTVLYKSPAIGTLSNFVCTHASDSAKTATFTTTVEQDLATDGFAYGAETDSVTYFTAQPISLRTLPDTRDSTIGAGQSKVPIGYGMYLSIPAVYYNAKWDTAAVAGVGATTNGGAGFSVIVTVDIANAWATQTTAASVDVEDAECSNRGHCDRSTGTCACYEGYYGDHCGMQTILV
jgi:hypothetical protein